MDFLQQYFDKTTAYHNALKILERLDDVKEEYNTLQNSTANPNEYNPNAAEFADKISSELKLISLNLSLTGDANLLKILDEISAVYSRTSDVSKEGRKSNTLPLIIRIDSNKSEEDNINELLKQLEKSGLDVDKLFFKNAGNNLASAQNYFKNRTNSLYSDSFNEELSIHLNMQDVLPDNVPKINGIISKLDDAGREKFVAYVMEIIPTNKANISFFLKQEDLEFAFWTMNEISRIFNTLHENGITHNDFFIKFIEIRNERNQISGRRVFLHNFVLVCLNESDQKDEKTALAPKVYIFDPSEPLRGDELFTNAYATEMKKLLETFIDLAKALRSPNFGIAIDNQAY